MFFQNGVGKHEYLGEYTGELISHREADKRGKIYDRENSSNWFVDVIYFFSNWWGYKSWDGGLIVGRVVECFEAIFCNSSEERLKCCPSSTKEIENYFNGYANYSLIAGDNKSLTWNDRLLLVVGYVY